MSTRFQKDAREKLVDIDLDADLTDASDSWNCVDCGKDTAPDFLTKQRALDCIQAGQKKYTLRFNSDCEVYMVRDAIWKQAGMEPWGGCLCVLCLEKRLGRELKFNDFVHSHEFNQLPGSPLLMKRRKP
jgi:hypothetical protein